MKQFAPVAPLSGLRRLAEEGVLGNYQLLIAPLILQREEAYLTFFEHRPDQFVIVDNGVIEQGYPLAVPLLYRAIRMVNADVLVLPDTIDDGKMTAKQVRKALPEYRRMDTETDVMGVVQGETFEECMECARQLVEAGVDWLAVPRGLTPNLGSRVELVQALGDAYWLPMHILGFSNNILDDMAAATAHERVRGIDAATPLWWKGALPPVPPSQAEETLHLGRRPKDFWQMAIAGRASDNVQMVRAWLSDAQNARTTGHALVHPKDPSTLTSSSLVKPPDVMR